MRTILSALAFILVLAGAAAAQDARYGEQKAVYHLNEGGGDEDRAYLAAMGNIQNHVNAVGAGNLTAAVVMHGDGLGLLARALENDRLQTLIASLKTQGVKFVVCNNTLVGRDIDPDADLYDVWDEDIVPSGVAELAHLQAQGYAYVKP